MTANKQHLLPYLTLPTYSRQRKSRGEEKKTPITPQQHDQGTFPVNGRQQTGETATRRKPYSNFICLHPGSLVYAFCIVASIPTYIGGSIRILPFASAPISSQARHRKQTSHLIYGM
ncbi:hypothetical protein BO71DRAFT_75564 [Aspergillus ellipticus CBS 707.79]|uniref:Uncharacterized protein n=1 Tax=Aspergillus ellipticus CBS 707.79 TaxID=1448320 RepID=A0A319D0A2_9EURO|nr:hypothetical protein BO71DRAFT_75564 [Aspergillus ellipticus CBS 707.79]